MSTIAAKQHKTHDWGMFLIGIALVVCAFILVLWPGATLVSLALVAGFMLLFAGGADISAFATAKGQEGRGWILVTAITDIILGAMFIIHPIAAAAVLPWLAGAFVITSGIVALASAFALRGIGSLWAVALIGAILSIAIGVLFIVFPTAFVLFLGLYLAMRGVLMCIYGIVSPSSLAF